MIKYGVENRRWMGVNSKGNLPSDHNAITGWTLLDKPVHKGMQKNGQKKKAKVHAPRKSKANRSSKNKKGSSKQTNGKTNGKAKWPKPVTTYVF